MGGVHRKGVKITLNSLLDEQRRLTARISRMFDAYVKACKHYKRYNRCKHPCNRYPSSKNHHYMCNIDRCPDRGKI